MLSDLIVLLLHNKMQQNDADKNLSLLSRTSHDALTYNYFLLIKNQYFHLRLHFKVR